MLPERKTIAQTCLVLYAASQAFFLINIQTPRKHNFDEFHYVPAAKQFIELKENQNWEHPPLGKEIMAVGIVMFGDNPFGWRFFSTVFGALTLVGMYLWGLALFGNQIQALQAAGLTLVNHLLYVQARIGMLDTFMMGFLALGLASFSAVWTRERDPGPIWAPRFLAFSGLMFGLATATKWFAVIPWAFCAGIMIMAKLFSSWGVRFATPRAAARRRGGGGGSSGKKSRKKTRDAIIASADTDHRDSVRAPVDEDWYAPGLLAHVTWVHLFLYLGVIPVVVYFSCFLPFLLVHREPAYTLWDICLMQLRIYDGQLRVVNTHPNRSTWGGWPLMLRPIWYIFEREGEKGEFARGVLLLGNPAIMWAGLAAVGYCAWNWLNARSRQAFLITAFWAALYLCWGVMPRKLGFYYYYYPAGLVLSFALVYSFAHMDRVGNQRFAWVKWAFFTISLAHFIHFFPILSGLRIEADAFRKWMWPNLLGISWANWI